jgi:hypothetical protein
VRRRGAFHALARRTRLRPELTAPAFPDLERRLIPVPGKGTRALFFTGKGGFGKRRGDQGPGPVAPGACAVL